MQADETDTVPAHERAERLIRELALVPHPEGGFYRQVFKSPAAVGTANGSRRSALTGIYFLLPSGGQSRWHRVRSDEVWTFVEGAPITLWTFDGRLARSQTVGPLDRSALPFVLVPADVWQAAEPDGPYSLVACFVAPGFEFEDFAMMSDQPDAARVLSTIAPELARLI